jgi:hypothetical protein
MREQVTFSQTAVGWAQWLECIVIQCGAPGESGAKTQASTAATIIKIG